MYINPFTAPAWTIPGLKDAGPITHLLSMLQRKIICIPPVPRCPWEVVTADLEENDVGFLGNSAPYTAQQCAAVRH